MTTSADNPRIVTELEAIRLEDIECAYIGREGCRCGCLGNYAYPNAKACATTDNCDGPGSKPRPRAVQMRLDLIRQLARDGAEIDVLENDQVSYHANYGPSSGRREHSRAVSIYLVKAVKDRAPEVRA